MICPKCGHNQNPSDTCIHCGIVFAKFYEIQKRKAEDRHRTSKPEGAQVEPEESRLMGEALSVPGEGLEGSGPLDNLRRQWSLPWNPVSALQAGALSAGFALMVYLLATRGLMGSNSTILYMVHNVNLVFHEAGHWIFGIFGNDTLAIFGGSLNQVLIPLVVAGSFWLKRDAVGFAFGLFWCFENFLDVAVYMADARALVLPLIGGLGEEAHDWRNLFLKFGLIYQDTAIASKTNACGWFGMIAAWVFLLWRWLMSPKTTDGRWASS